MRRSHVVLYFCLLWQSSVAQDVLSDPHGENASIKQAKIRREQDLRKKEWFLQEMEPGSEQYIYENLWLKRNGSGRVRPLKWINDSVTVEVAPILTGVVALDEIDERITLSLTFMMRWHNDYIYWDPENAVKVITVPCTEMWTPKVTTETTLDLLEFPNWETEQCRIEYNGDVSVFRNQIQTSICQLDIFKFPFDTQVCTLQYTAWGYADALVDLKALESFGGVPVELRSAHLQDIPEWKIGTYVAQEVVSKTPDGDQITYVSYELTIHRKSLHYIVNIIVPSFIICTLSLIGLFSPSEGTAQVRNEKISMGLTCLLTMSVMLLVVSEDLPKTNVGSLLGHYVIMEFLWSTVATVVATKLVYLNKLLVQDKPLPTWVNMLACMGKVKDENTVITEHEKNFTMVRRMVKEMGTGSRKTSQSHHNSFQISNGHHDSKKSVEATKISQIYKHQPLAMLVDQCLKHVVYMRQAAEQAQLDADELIMRSEVLCKLENVLMIFFLTINIVATIIWFILGLLL